MLLGVNFKSIKPANMETGYTKDEIMSWIALMTGSSKKTEDKTDTKTEDNKKTEDKGKSSSTDKTEGVDQKTIDDAASLFDTTVSK